MNTKPVNHKLQLDNAVIEYAVQRNHRRKTIVHLSVFNGNIVVSAPMRVPDHEIQAIVWGQSGWILDKLAKMSAGSKELSLPELATGDAVPHSGRKLPLAVNEAALAAEKSKQVVARRDAERRQQEIKRAKRAALMANLLKSPIAVAAVVATLIHLPIVRYKQHRLEGKEAKQAAAERQWLDAERIKQASEREAERQRLEAQRAKQAAAQREAERQRLEEERAKQVAMMVQQQKREEYWESLGGIEFEQELGKLFKARGYWVEYTPVSGDQGIDLILRKNDKTTVVQCKAQQRPATPRVVRELYGSMVAYRADNAILACTGGFTDGVIKFAHDKPIRLMDAQEIARVAEYREWQSILVVPYRGVTGDPPTCPKRGCGRTMELRDGRRGIFWGCPSYPDCRGTRDL